MKPNYVNKFTIAIEQESSNYISISFLDGITEKVILKTHIIQNTIQGSDGNLENKAYKEYSTIRTDGLYVEAGENDNLIVAKLDKNRAAFGVFGYSFLEENADKVQGSNVDAVAPTPDTISSGKYPISRSLFIYIKNSHATEVPAINSYVKMYMSDNMISSKGILRSIGLIPLPQKEIEAVRSSVEKKAKVTLESLAKK